MSGVRIALRYFPVLGRAQALRLSLWDAGVEFEDLRVSLSDWPSHRENSSFSGHYRALPTLSWAEVILSETLPIAGFIARRLGQHANLGDEAIAYREGLCSTSYIDVLLRVADLIRADVTYPGADCGRAFGAIAGRLMQKAERIEKQIPVTGWIGGERPVVADFFVAEAFEVLRYVLGPARDSTLRDRLPRIATLARAVDERPRLVTAVRDRPTRFTARPDEDQVVERLRAVDLSSIGL